MEKAAFLMAVDRVIGRVQVQDDLARGLGPEGVEEEVDEHGLDRGRVMPDLVIAPARCIRRSMLQPVCPCGMPTPPCVSQMLETTPLGDTYSQITDTSRTSASMRRRASRKLSPYSLRP